MEITYSWKRVVPDDIKDRYEFIETRNAAANFRASHADEFDEVMRVLKGFRFDVDRIARPGLNKHLIAYELDEAFRELGWREARYDQRLITRLVLQPYRPSGERSETVRQTENEYSGHKVDNVKGRIGLDVEWNPKDGNLDRDFGNFRALYDGGALDVGVILTRTQAEMRERWIDVIARAEAITQTSVYSAEWRERMRKTPHDPLGTSTTSNFEKLKPRVERGDAGGCPFLAIAITAKCYDPPDDLDTEIVRIAAAVGRGEEPIRLAQKMGLIAPDTPLVVEDVVDDSD